MGQHRDVAAVNSVGAGVHPFRKEAFQFRLNRAVMVGDDVPARLRLPSDARRIPDFGILLRNTFTAGGR